MIENNHKKKLLKTHRASPIALFATDFSCCNASAVPIALFAADFRCCKE